MVCPAKMKNSTQWTRDVMGGIMQQAIAAHAQEFGMDIQRGDGYSS